MTGLPSVHAERLCLLVEEAQTAISALFEAVTDGGTVGGRCTLMSPEPDTPIVAIVADRTTLHVVSTHGDTTLVIHVSGFDFTEGDK